MPHPIRLTQAAKAIRRETADTSKPMYTHREATHREARKTMDITQASHVQRVGDAALGVAVLGNAVLGVASLGNTPVPSSTAPQPGVASTQVNPTQDHKTFSSEVRALPWFNVIESVDAIQDQVDDMDRALRNDQLTFKKELIRELDVQLDQIKRDMEQKTIVKIGQSQDEMDRALTLVATRVEALVTTQVQTQVKTQIHELMREVDVLRERDVPQGELQRSCDVASIRRAVAQLHQEMTVLQDALHTRVESSRTGSQLGADSQTGANSRLGSDFLHGANSQTGANPQTGVASRLGAEFPHGAEFPTSRLLLLLVTALLAVLLAIAVGGIRNGQARSFWPT
jgi:hypothetical protein